jgi:hypothetical protein
MSLDALKSSPLNNSVSPRVHASAYALRSRNGLSGTQISQICNYVRAQIATQYSKQEAVRTFTGGSREFTRKQFCSQLVAQA